MYTHDEIQAILFSYKEILLGVERFISEIDLKYDSEEEKDTPDYSMRFCDIVERLKKVLEDAR